MPTVLYWMFGFFQENWMSTSQICHSKREEKRNCYQRYFHHHQRVKWCYEKFVSFLMSFFLWV